MNRLEHLRGLVASLRAASPDEPPLLDNNEVLAAENPSGQPRARLEGVASTLRSLAERLGDVEATPDVVAVLEDVQTAVTGIDAELAEQPNPAAVAASLLAAIGGTADVPTATVTPARPALGQVRPPAGHSPRRGASGGTSLRVTAVTAGGLAVESMGDLAKRVHSALFDGPQGPRSELVASVATQYPPERRLTMDAASNEQKLERVVGPTALTASGGVCGPVAVDYSIPEFSTPDRPLRDGLPRYQADRGGVTFNPTPSITDLAGATVVWTEANDVALSSPATKPVVTITCADPSTVYVNAVPTRVRFGNMQQRFNPEAVQAQVQSAMAAAARIAELSLWDTINSHATEVLATEYLGATRDILATIDLAVAGLRTRQRIPRTTVMRVVLEDWVRDLIRADLAREIAHDNSGAYNALAVTDAQIDEWFTVRGIRPIWVLDPLAAGGGTGRTYTLQGFGAQAAGGLVGWPAKTVFTVYPEGSFVFLDGGELNLGVVRDSTLDSTNDAEMFVEPFESVAFRGVQALKVVAPVLANGGSAGTIAASTYTAGA